MPSVAGQGALGAINDIGREIERLFSIQSAGESP